MVETSLQLLRCVKTCVTIAVGLTCTWFMAVGWKGMGFPTVQMIRSSARGDGNHSGDHRSLAAPPTQNVISVEPYSCSAVSNLKVLGKPLDRCATSKAVKMVEEEDIYVSVKTTSRNHVRRVLPILLTWFQTLQPKRVHIITDTISHDEVLYQVATKAGMDIVTTNCAKVHSHAALCCKSGNEFMRYFNTTNESGELHRWFCHFDDDMYANIPVLIEALREAVNKSKDGGVYFGRWPKENVPKLPDGMPVSRKTLKVLGFELEKELTVKWATGAAYCVTSNIMKKVKPIIMKHPYELYCARFGLSDDTTAAIFIGMAGYFLTDNKRVKTQYDGFSRISVSELPNLITISGTGVKVPNAKFSTQEDKTRFLSYHCLLYPSTSWCSKKSN